MFECVCVCARARARACTLKCHTDTNTHTSLSPAAPVVTLQYMRSLSVISKAHLCSVMMLLNEMLGSCATCVQRGMDGGGSRSGVRGGA